MKKNLTEVIIKYLKKIKKETRNNEKVICYNSDTLTMQQAEDLQEIVYNNFGRIEYKEYANGVYTIVDYWVSQMHKPSTVIEAMQ